MTSEKISNGSAMGANGADYDYLIKFLILGI